jgi:hypothetical protein
MEIELIGAAHLQGLGEHQVPDDDGENDEEKDDALGGHGGHPPDKLQLRLGKKAKGNIHQQQWATAPRLPPRRAERGGMKWSIYHVQPVFSDHPEPSLSQTAGLAIIFAKKMRGAPVLDAQPLIQWPQGNIIAKKFFRPWRD